VALGPLYRVCFPTRRSSDLIPAAQVHYANSIEGRLVVGHQYGEESNSISISSSLYSFASSNARWLMQLANIERFAVDDCIVLTKDRKSTRLNSSHLGISYAA